MNKKTLMKVVLGTVVASTLTGTIYYQNSEQSKALAVQGSLQKTQEDLSDEEIYHESDKNNPNNEISKEEEEKNKKILLREGDSGDAIITLQKRLYNLGYDVFVDGNFGQKTTEYIKEFQSKSNLEKTGNYDGKTDELLSKASPIRNYDNIKTLEERIKSYLGNDINNVGFVYYDLNSGTKININENKLCTAASTYKVGMNLVAYDKATNGKLNLNEGLTYNDSYYEDGTGILQGQIDTTLRKPVSIQKLLDYAIKYSDNIATNMVTAYLGGGQTVRQAVCDITGIQIDITNNKITPEMEFRLLKKLYEGRANENYSHLISVMKQTEFHDRMDKYVPQNIVAHKIGNYGSYTNDVGIVFADKPYIFVMYTDGISDANEKIAKISKMIYDSKINK